MEVENQGSRAPSSESSAPDATTDSGQTQEIETNSQSAAPSEETADFKRLREDMLKYKKDNQLLKKQMDDLKQQKMKEQNDWKTLYEEELGKRESFEKGYVKEKKQTALRSAVQKLGLRPEAEQDLDLLGLDQIHEEFTSDGRILVHGAEQYAEELKKTRSWWFKSSEPPKFNPGGGKGPDQPKELSAQYMVSLEKKDPKKYRELMPVYLEQTRKRKLQG